PAAIEAKTRSAHAWNSQTGSISYGLPRRLRCESCWETEVNVGFQIQRVRTKNTGQRKHLTVGALEWKLAGGISSIILWNDHLRGAIDSENERTDEVRPERMNQCGNCPCRRNVIAVWELPPAAAGGSKNSAVDVVALIVLDEPNKEIRLWIDGI